MGCCAGCSQSSTENTSIENSRPEPGRGESGDNCLDACCDDPEKFGKDAGSYHSANEGAFAEAGADHCHTPAAKATTIIASDDSHGADDCCKPALKNPAVVAGDDGRCGANRVVDDCHNVVDTSVTDGCTENWCAGPPSADEKPKKTSCCDDRSSPCCDISCLDRLAARECRGAIAGQGKESCTPRSSDGHDDGSACSQHKRSVRSRYSASLEALQCICSALLALGQETCCVSTPRSSSDRKRGSKPKQRASFDSCRTSGSAISQKNCNQSSGRRRQGATSCCAKDVVRSCSETRGEENFKDASIETTKRYLPNVTSNSDPEKGLFGYDHVILSVSGMTCTGCETKLSRTLGSLATIKNLKTSLVLSRAEFDVNLGASSVPEVIAYMQRTTEFKFERISNQGSTIDIIPEGDLQKFLKMGLPIGVTEMTAIDQKTVRVAFDAKIIGVRDLLNKNFGTEHPVKLSPPRLDPTLDAGSKHVRYVGYMTLLSAMLTIPVLVLAWSPLPEHELIYGSISLVFATVVQLVVAGPFYPKCLKALIFSRVIEMDLLIVLSTTAAYIFSVIAFGYMDSGKPLSTGEFFETSTLLVTLVMVGRWVSAFARQKAVESISIRSLQVSTATLVSEDGEETEIDARLLQYGDVFKIAPDSRIPTDGTVISGSSEVDESMITGESRPVEKDVKFPVIAGSINGSGTIIARLTRIPSENTVSTIAHMVDEAKLSKAKIQATADRVASYFVPIVLVITIITFVIWVAVGLTLKAQSGSEAAVNAITYAMAVLIVSCPCAIGLAVPMVIVIASGAAADRGVIFKSSEAIEIAYKTSHVVFDKTGTLTQGKLAVVAEDSTLLRQDGPTTDLLLGLVGSIKHPVSVAVATYLKSRSVSSARVDCIKSFPGKGVEGQAPSGQILRAGNSRWLNLSTDPRVSAVLDRGLTAFCFTIDDSLAVVFGLEDSLRPDALETVTKLQKRGIVVSLLSGDDDGAVRAVASQLSIPSDNVRSGCNPADKKRFIEDLLTKPVPPTKSGKKFKTPVVIFCGDGTNDAVALAQATIGVHMNEGTDVAQSAADVVLMRPNLLGILTIINTSKVSIHRIACNFGWSFIYNVFAILLAAGAFVHARIPPKFAGLGELVSVLPVIAAAVLLRWSKI